MATPTEFNTTSKVIIVETRDGVTKIYADDFDSVDTAEDYRKNSLIDDYAVTYKVLERNEDGSYTSPF
jgi:hypothetical protein